MEKQPTTHHRSRAQIASFGNRPERNGVLAVVSLPADEIPLFSSKPSIEIYQSFQQNATATLIASPDQILEEDGDDEGDISDGVDAGKDLDLVKIYLREIGKIPIQKEKHARWAAEVFVGEIALKNLDQLSKSPLLVSIHKEKIASALGSKKATYLFEHLTSRIELVQQRLNLNKYNSRNKDERKAIAARELDEEFLIKVLENEVVVQDILDEAKEVDDDSKEVLIGQFIDTQIDFVKQGQNSHDRLVEANQRLCVSIAKRYSGRGISLLDLINYGNFGLMKAAADFDYRTGNHFSTYATWWIRQTVTRALADYGSTIRFPVHVYDQIIKWKRTQGQDFEEDGKPLDNPPKPIRDALALQTIYSLDMSVSNDPEKHQTLMDFIDSPDQDQGPEEAADTTSLKDTIRDVFKTLSDREARVLILRFGTEDDRPRTLEEVAREFGVTPERIRQIEKKAMIKLKDPIVVRKLRSLFEE